MHELDLYMDSLSANHCIFIKLRESKTNFISIPVIQNSGRPLRIAKILIGLYITFIKNINCPNRIDAGHCLNPSLPITVELSELSSEGLTSNKYKVTEAPQVEDLASIYEIILSKELF